MPRRTTLISWIATWPIRPDVAGFRAAPTPPRSSARRCRPRKNSASRWTAPTAASRRWRSARSVATGRRVGFAGRYDDAWLAERFPFLPADFDERYFQSAPADQWTDHLRGGEEVLLLNLTGEERAAFRVPRREVPVTFFLKKGGHETAQARIDTLLVDCDARRVEVTWRIRRPLKRNLFEIAQVLVGSKSAAWWRARELGKDYYPSLAALARSRQAEEDEA